MRRVVLGAGLFVALAVPAALTAHKESVLASGRVVFLQLAPVDPRSLMQGDYMSLRYKAADDVQRSRDKVPRDGFLVVRLDEKGVAAAPRVDEPGVPLAEGEIRVRYRLREKGLRLGAESFFFQEGQADLFAKARFGELRVSPEGESVLVGLRDADLVPLGPPRRAW